VRHHIDEELDNRKHVYYGIDSVLVRLVEPLNTPMLTMAMQSKVAEQIGQKVSPNYARALNIVYFPQLGASSFSFRPPGTKEL
jgi:DNA mismatch repair protein MSH5